MDFTAEVENFIWNSEFYKKYLGKVVGDQIGEDIIEAIEGGELHIIYKHKDTCAQKECICCGPIRNRVGPNWNSQSGGPLRDNTSGENNYCLPALLSLIYFLYSLLTHALPPDDLRSAAIF